MEILHLEIVTPSGTALDQRVDEVLIPGVEGELGVLPGHIPLLSAIRPGVLSYRQGRRTTQLAIGKGFAEVGLDNHVLVLSQACLDRDSIDQRAAAHELEQARDRLARTTTPLVDAEGNPSPEHRDAEEELRWAEARIDVG